MFNKSPYLKTELYQALSADERIFDFFQEYCLDGFWVWDITTPANKWLDNRFFKNLGFGVSNDELGDTDWFKLIHLEDDKLLWEAVQNDITNPRLTTNHVIRLCHANGSLVSVRCVGIVLCMSGDKIGRMLWGCSNISEGAELQEAVLREATKRRILFEQAKEGIFILNDLLEVVDANESLSVMLNRPISEITQFTEDTWKEIWVLNDGALGLGNTPMLENATYEAHVNRPGMDVAFAEISFHRAILSGKEYLFYSCRDISARQLGRKALEQSEERFRLAVHATRDGLWEWEIETNREYFSPRWCEIIGFDAEDSSLAHTFESWALRIHPEDYDLVMAAIDNNLKFGTVYDVEYRHMHTSGEYRWQSSRGHTVRDADGKPIKMIGCISDITQRKQAEEEIKSVNERLESLIEAIPDAIFFKDGLGRWMVANHLAQKILRIEHFDWHSKTELQLAEQRSGFEQVHLKCHKDDEKAWENKRLTLFQELVMDEQGELREYEVRKLPIFNPDGSRKALVVVGNDITEKKKAQAQIIESGKQLDLFFNNSLEGFFFMMLDEPLLWNEETDKEKALDYIYSNMRVTKTNQAMLEQYGASLEEFMGSTPLKFFANDPAYGRAFTREVLDKGRCRKDTYELRFDGSPMWVEGAYICLYNEEGLLTGLFGIQRDVTRRKLAEKRMEQKQIEVAKHNSVLKRLSTTSFEHYGTLGVALETITEAIVECIGVKRASIWKYAEQHIVCRDLFDKDAQAHSSGMVMESHDYPTYFSALNECLVLIANDAKTSPYTKEFTEKYLEPLQIDAMLDVPIRSGGELMGIVCCEDGNGPREWTEEEVGFVRAIGDIVTLTIEAAKRKATEESLVQSQKEYKHLVASIPMGVFKFKRNADGTNQLTYVSPVFCKFNKIPEEKALADFNAMFRFMKPQDKLRFDEDLDKAIAAESKFFWEGESNVFGATRYSRVEARSHKDENNVVYWSGIQYDITDNKRNEIQLSQKEEQFRGLISNISSVAFRCVNDEHWTMVFISDEIERMTGYSPKDFVQNHNRSFASIIHPDDRQMVEDTLGDTLDHGDPYQLEYRIIASDGKVLWIHERGRFFVGNSETGEIFLDGVMTDISDSKQIANELYRTRELLEDTASLARVGTWEVELRTKKLYWSKVCYEIHEVYGGPELNQEKAILFYKEGKHRERIKEYMDLALDGHPFDDKFILVTAKGVERWVRVIAKVEMDEGVPTRIFGSIQDIDEQVRSQAALAESEARFRDIIEASPVPLIVYMPDVGNIYVSPKFTEIFGYDIFDIPTIEEWWLAAYPDVEYRDWIKAEWFRKEMEALEQNISMEPMEVLVICKNGEEKCVLIGESPMEGGTFLVTFFEITELRKAARALEQSEERLALVLKGANDAPWDWDVEKDVRYYSDKWWDMLGYGTNELEVNDTLWDLMVHPDDKSSAFEAFAKAMSEGTDNYQIEFRLRHKQGHYVPVLSRAFVKRNANGQPIRVSGTNQDLTERKKLEDSLKKAKELAEAASNAKSEFLANMSHEIRTPLNGVIGFSELLMKTPLDSSQHEYMSTVHQSANALLDIVNDILDFSKIEAGKLELSLEKKDLHDICRQVADVVKFQAGKKNIKMLLDISAKAPQYVWVDAVRLRQVLINLLGNAVKFTEEGEIEMKLEVLRHVSKNETICRFSVRDTGTGIDQKNQKKIFEAFAQEDASTTRKFGGTGLGLSISNKLLSLMNSELHLESEPGQGSKFYFDIQLASAEGGIAHDEEKRENTMGSVELEIFKGPVFSSNDERSYKIMVVEDNAVNLLLAKTIVHKFIPGVIILEAKNGVEAVDIYKIELPDLIFMDVQMPEMNGYDATIAIRAIEIGKKVPIIALTAGTIKGEKDKCLAVGMSDYITKPIAKGALEAAIFKWLSVQNTNPD